MTMRHYTAAVARRLNLPKDVKQRVMTDFNTTVAAMQEAGKSDDEIRGELGTPKKVAAELNEQMREYAFRKSPWRFVFLALAVLSGLWLAAYRVILWLFDLLTGITVTLSPGEMGGLGVIGGADGPTAIFVTATSSGFDWDLLIVTGMLVVGITAYLRLCRCKPRQ